MAVKHGLPRILTTIHTNIESGYGGILSHQQPSLFTQQSINRKQFGLGQAEVIVCVALWYYETVSGGNGESISDDICQIILSNDSFAIC
jgi:hypothetical protein